MADTDFLIDLNLIDRSKILSKSPTSISKTNINKSKTIFIPNHRSIPVWFFDAVVQHFYDYGAVVWKVDHQLLALLHLPEPLLVHRVGIVEEQVVLRSQLDPYVCRLLLVALYVSKRPSSSSIPVV